MVSQRFIPKCGLVRLSGIVFIGLFLVLFSLGGPVVAAKDVLNVAQSGDAKTLDPHKTNDSVSSKVTVQIFENLVTQTENMELVPGLAESWELPDDRTYVFKLAKGVKFHDGSELKASDVKFSYDRILNPETKSPGRFLIAMVESVSIQDDVTVKITLKNPFAPFLSHLAHPATSIVSEKAVKELGDKFGQNPVGTGPFKFVSWKSGSSIELERFDGFHGAPAKVARLVFHSIPETANRTIGLETGALDISYAVAPEDIPLIEGNPDLRLNRTPNLTVNYIGFHTQKKPFDDLRVRHAISMAFDPESIIMAVYKGVGSVLTAPIGPRVWAHNPNIKPYPFDIEAAKKLLKEAGHENGFEMTLLTWDDPLRGKIAEIFQAQMAEIGVKVKIDVLEWGTFLERINAGEFEMFTMGWTTVTADPDYGLYPLFHSSSFGSTGNRFRYSNPEVDELLDKGRTAFNSEERKAIYYRAQEKIFADAPMIFILSQETLDGTRAEVQGFVQSPAGHNRLSSVFFK